MFKLIILILSFLTGTSYAPLTEFPCPRNQPVVVYDVKKDAMFLFGGYCSQNKKRLNDLWEYRGRKWKQVLTHKAPEARSGHAMVYDTFQERLLVFGGKNDEGQLLNDLWSWDGVQWMLLANAGPVSRQSHRLALNTNTGEIFLFGGSNEKKEGLNDTWIYKEGKWSELHTSTVPAARLQHTLVYDSHRDKMVLFGGFNRTDDGKIVYGDTWECDKKQGWQLKNDAEEMARDHHAMVYDPTAQTIFLFGGYHQGYFGDTQSWNGENWTLETNDGPSKRAGKPGLIYDASKQTIVLFGGWDKTNKPLMDFWIFDSKRKLWREQS